MVDARNEPRMNTPAINIRESRMSHWAANPFTRGYEKTITVPYVSLDELHAQLPRGLVAQPGALPCGSVGRVVEGQDPTDFLLLHRRGCPQFGPEQIAQKARLVRV